MKRIKVELGERSYSIIIGFGLLDRVGEIVEGLNLGDSVFLVSQMPISSLYGDRCVESFKREGFSVRCSLFGEEEKDKSWESLQMVLSEMVRFDEPGKKRCFVATLGGGVVGDLGGFASAIYKRGIDYIQIPTTLLSNVDAGIGGKCAINFCGIKNLVGSFHQPRLVLSDLSLLSSLPKKEILSAMAEIVKYGVICDEKFFAYIEDNFEKILLLEPSSLRYVVSSCYKMKADIVAKDERDTKGIRARLNFGHTIGHAIENTYKLSHGEAVSVGMIAASSIACHLGMFAREEKDRLEDLLKRIGLCTKIKGSESQKIMSALLHDKKFLGKTRLVLPNRIGEVKVVDGIEESLIQTAIEERMERCSML
ncbi:MAG: 3-dehydroquinate synthase [Candidatus Desantisbacteria bacterium]